MALGVRAVAFDDAVVLDDSPSVEERLAAKQQQVEHHQVLCDALGELSGREAEVLYARLQSSPCPTFAQIGGLLGMSGERVRQLQHCAARKLTRAVSKHDSCTLHAQLANHARARAATKSGCSSTMKWPQFGTNS